MKNFMKRTHLLRVLPLALAAIPAFGYVSWTYTGSAAGSTPVQILRPDPTKIQMYVNTALVAAGVKSAVTNAVVINAGSTPVNAIETAMASWNNLGSANILFSPLQTTSASPDPSDCKNIITVGTTNADLSVLGYVAGVSNGAVAATANFIVGGSGKACNGTLDVVAGNIIDSDIILNPLFTFSTDGTANTQDLQGVITHELGHLLGMNHSGLLGATMYPFAARYQRHLSWDEKDFAAVYYSSGKTQLGAVSGTVTLSGTPVAYGLIIATEVSGSGKMIGGLTGLDGTYSLSLPSGTYNIYAEPFNSYIGAANIYSLTGPGGHLDPTKATTTFGATFAGGNADPPTTYTVSAGSSTTANISVIPAVTSLSLSYFGIGPANASTGVNGKGYSSIAGAISVAGGNTFDIALAGPGINASTILHFNGSSVDVANNGAGRLDTGGTVGGFTPVRYTLTVGNQTNPTLGSLFLVKDLTTLISLSGIFNIEPTAPTVNNVLDAESARATIVSGQYLAVYGQNLSNNTRSWSATTDFTGGVAAGNPLPTTLDGVSVTINGLPASIFFVSPGQLNIIAPAGLTPGPANIVVWNNNSPSVTFKGTTIGTASPSFFISAGGGNFYPYAVHLDASRIGDPAVQSGTTRAHPGETILLFANGLQASDGNSVAAATVIDSSQYTLSAGSNKLTVLGAALVYAGEFQINVQIPASTPPGNYQLSLSVPGGSTADLGLTLPLILPIGQ